MVKVKTCARMLAYVTALVNHELLLQNLSTYLRRTASCVYTCRCDCDCQIRNGKRSSRSARGWAGLWPRLQHERRYQAPHVYRSVITGAGARDHFSGL